MQYKIELERILTRELRKVQRRASEVRITADGEFALYNVADRYTVRRLSGRGKDFLRRGHMGPGSPEDCLIGGLIHSGCTQTDSRLPQVPYRCRDCGGEVGLRSRNRKWIDRYILPVLLLRPVRCATCFRRDYWPVSTRVWERRDAEMIVTRDFWRKAA